MKHLILIFMILLSPFYLKAATDSPIYITGPVISSYKNEMYKKREYLANGTGYSMPGLSINWLFISFVGKQRVDIPEARRLYIEVVEGFVERMNENKKIRPYLHDYPATRNNARIKLFCRFGNENDVIFIRCIEDDICYSIVNQTKGINEMMHCESYEEALKILQDESLTK